MNAPALQIGITVTDLDRSLSFYRDTLGLSLKNETTFEQQDTQKLFKRPNCYAKIASLQSSDTIESPSVELIEFTSKQTEPPKNNFLSSISEICFFTDNLWREYHRLCALGVEFLCKPHDFFDFTIEGFQKSRAMYFKEPDGMVLKMVEVF